MEQHIGKGTCLETGMFIVLGMSLLSSAASAQCQGTWDFPATMSYQCTVGPFLQFDLGDSICPVSPQATFTLSSPVQTVELIFSAFGTYGTSGSSRLAVFLNGSPVDLALACRTELGCQMAVGDFSLDDGCLVDQIGGTDGGIAGFIYTEATEYGLSGITTVGVAVSEPGGSGTIFQIGVCNEGCGGAATGAPDRAGHDQGLVFPDPFSTQAILRVEEDMNDAVLTLFNAQGQQVRQVRSIRGRTVVIDRDGLPSGSCYLQLTESNRTIARRSLMITDN